MFELTWYVSITVLKGMEVIHKFFNRDLEGLKEAGVFKEPVGDLNTQNYYCQKVFEHHKTYKTTLSHARGGKNITH